MAAAVLQEKRRIAPHSDLDEKPANSARMQAAKLACGLQPVPGLPDCLKLAQAVLLEPGPAADCSQRPCLQMRCVGLPDCL
mmetsp:Transcript_145575/g.265022  ORF Transcript_145575/g.265022 Transcript_145575/m.265022 type:complete len:81 (+) Transcript_145575:234-476(+)